jgi:hypothetical protein
MARRAGARGDLKLRGHSRVVNEIIQSNQKPVHLRFTLESKSGIHPVI